jgi:hypothetical protein
VGLQISVSLEGRGKKRFLVEYDSTNHLVARAVGAPSGSLMTAQEVIEVLQRLGAPL